MESSSGEAADQKDALRDKLEEAKQQAEEQAALDKQFSIPPEAFKQACSELYHINR